MAKLADAPDLGSGGEIHGGSSPPFRTFIYLRGNHLDALLAKIHESESEINFTVSPEEYAEGFEQEYKKELTKVTIPGFRKGKVPRSVAEKYYGDALKFQVAERVATNVFYDYAEANGIHPVGTPGLVEFDYKPEQNLVFKIKFEHFPQLKEINYKGYTIEVPDLQVTDEMVDREYDGIKAEKVVKEPGETVDSTDYSVVVDLLRIDDGEGSEGSQPQKLDVNLPRSKPEITAALMNKKVGDEFAFEFSDTHSHHHEGEEKEEEHTVVYKYTGTVLEINKLIYPEETAEFIQELSNKEASTVEEFKAVIKRDYSKMFEEQTTRQIRQNLSAKLVEANDFTVGKHQLDYYLNKIVDEELKEQKEKGKHLSKEAVTKRLESTALRNVKLYYIEKAIIEAEKLTVSDERMEEIAKQEAEKLNYDYEAILNIYKSNDNFKETLLQEELYEFLLKNNTVVKIDKTNVPAGHHH